MIAGTVSIQMEADMSKLAKDMKDAERSTAGTMEKIGAAIGAGMAAGWEKAKTAWQAFKEWSERQIVIWGVALAIGVSAVVLGAVYAAFKGISFAVGLLTGESYKSKNIDALVAMNKEVKTLQENLPLTAVGASALNEALKTQGTTAEVYTGTINSVSSAVRSNRDELDRLGVKYKDQNGNLLTTNETLASAAGVLETYTEGWDRNHAALAIGMGTEKQIQAALSVTAEKIQVAKDRLIAYGLVIGTDTQAAVARYEDSMRAFNRELDLTSNGFSRAISDNIMPALTDLSDFFREGFPTAVMAFRYSFATVTSLFYGLKTSAFIVAESVLGAVESIGIGIVALGVASFRAMHGDFSGAKDALVKGWEDAQKRLALVGDNIVAQAQRNAAAMALAWGADSIGAGPNAKPKTGQAFIPKGTDGMDEAAIAAVIAEDKAIRARESKEAEFLVKALQDGMDEEAKVMAEAAQLTNDFRARERAEIQAQYDWRNQTMIDAYDAEQAEAIRHGQELIAIDEMVAANKRAQMQDTMKFLGVMAGMMSSKSREMFEVGKAAAIAETIVQTIVAAQGAEASASKIPYVGWILGPIAAAAAIVSGMARVSTIQSTQFGGGGGSLSSGGGGGGAVPTFSANPNTGVPTEPIGGRAQSSQTTIIDTSWMRDEDIFSGKTMRKFIEKVEEMTRDGGRVITTQ